MPNGSSIPEWAAALLIFALALCFIVGPRLLWVAWRTRKWPEFALGLFAVTIALGNIGTVIAGRHPGSVALPAASQLLTVIGAAVFYTAAWRVFRPNSTRGAIAASLGALTLIGGWAGRVWVDGDPLWITSPSPSNLILLLARCGAFGWWALEAFLYSRKVSRQETIGLAPPGTATRFVLWSVVGTTAVVMLSGLLVLTLVGATLADFPPSWVVLALGIVVANTAGYISFFRPSLLNRRTPAVQPDG